MASINNNWYTINDQTKYLTKLLKDRNFYINNFKTNNKIKEEEEMNIKEIINQLIDLDNENKELKYKIQRLEEKPNYKKLQKENIIDEIKEEYFINGVEGVSSYYLEEVFNSAQIFNEDTRNFLDFNSWYSTITINDSYRKYVFTKKTLNNLSNKEIIELYKPYLKKKYDKLIGDKRVELMNEAKEEKKSNDD